MTSLTKAEFPTYQGGQDKALWLTAALWALALGSLVGLRFVFASGSAWGTPLAFLAVFVLVGWCQASLSNGFHEAVHRNFGKNHKEWLSLALLGYPTFFTMQYRTVHLQHHLKGGDREDDPDFATYGRFPKSRLEMLGRFFMMGSGLAAAQQLLTKNLRSGEVAAGRLKKDEGSGDAPATAAPTGDLLGLAAVQLTLLAFFTAVFGPLFGYLYGPLFYVALWILPLGTVAKLIKATRSFCEHGSRDRDYVLRTITGKPWQTGTLGMYGFNFHAEHHLYPWVPYASLSALHDRLASDLASEPETHQGEYVLFEGGYFGLLVHWFKELPWRAPAESSAVQA